MKTVIFILVSLAFTTRGQTVSTPTVSPPRVSTSTVSPPRFSTPTVSPPTDSIECTREGTMCKNCEDLIYCKRTGDIFTEIPLTSCDPQTPCDATKNGCVYGGTCRYKKFKCPRSGTGIYPDPYSCLAYHDCNEGSDKEGKCLPPKAFDPNTKNCDYTFNDPFCAKGPVGICERNGQILQVEGQDYYFECLKEIDQYYDIIYPSLVLEPATSDQTPSAYLL